jgi:hypothetical protein
LNVLRVSDVTRYEGVATSVKFVFAERIEMVFAKDQSGKVVEIKQQRRLINTIHSGQRPTITNQWYKVIFRQAAGILNERRKSA